MCGHVFKHSSHGWSHLGKSLPQLWRLCRIVTRLGHQDQPEAMSHLEDPESFYLVPYFVSFRLLCPRMSTHNDRQEYLATFRRTGNSHWLFWRTLASQLSSAEWYFPPTICFVCSFSLPYVLLQHWKSSSEKGAESFTYCPISCPNTAAIPSSLAITGNMPVNTITFPSETESQLSYFQMNLILGNTIAFGTLLATT